MTSTSTIRLREPMNAATHIVAALAFIAPVWMLVTSTLALGKPVHAFSFAVFGCSLILAYVSSAAYHSVVGTPERIAFWRRIDHLAIFLLIGGTYSPFCLIPLGGTSGKWLFVVVWAIGLVGIVVKLFFKNAPRRVGVILYLAMGWVGLPFGIIGVDTMPVEAWAWLVGGGVVYSIGGVVYARKGPNIWPGVVEFHELWHLFAVGGSLCHFYCLWAYLRHM